MIDYNYIKDLHYFIFSTNQTISKFRSNILKNLKEKSLFSQVYDFYTKDSRDEQMASMALLLKEMSVDGDENDKVKDVLGPDIDEVPLEKTQNNDKSLDQSFKRNIYEIITKLLSLEYWIKKYKNDANNNSEYLKKINRNPNPNQISKQNSKNSKNSNSTSSTKTEPMTPLPTPLITQPESIAEGKVCIKQPKGKRLVLDENSCFVSERDDGSVRFEPLAADDSLADEEFEG